MTIARAYGTEALPSLEFVIEAASLRSGNKTDRRPCQLTLAPPRVHDLRRPFAGTANSGRASACG
jgi:hypothetical protein